MKRKKHTLTCCGTSHFRILYTGNLRRTWFGRLYIEQDENTAVAAMCPACHHEIPVFGEKREDSAEHKEFLCPKCSNNGFAVSENLEFTENEVTWQWVSLQCIRCGKTYRNILETEAD